MPENNQVTITLAHPLSAKYAVRHGLEDRDHDINEAVNVDRNSAQALIGAGYAAGIDPEDREAVASVLEVPAGEVASPQVSTTGQPGSGNANPDDDPAAGDQVPSTPVVAPAEQQPVDPAASGKPKASKTATPPA